MIKKTKVIRNFNRSATTYSSQTAIQQQMAHRLLMMIQKEKNVVNHILEIGCGTGYLTKQLCEIYPDAAITAVDISPQMLEFAKKEISHPVRFMVADGEAIGKEAGTSFDLIVSNAVVQWLNRPVETFREWSVLLSSYGQLWASTFGAKTFQELHHLFKKVETEQGFSNEHHGVILKEEREWKRILREAGMIDAVVYTEHYQQFYPDARQFLKGIRGMGATYSESTLAPILSARLLAEVIRQYDKRYQRGQGVPATYEAVWMMGKKSTV